MTTSGLRLDFDGGWIDRTGVFAAAATDAFFLLDTGAVLSIGINGMLRTLLLADQTELSVSPTQTLVMVNDGPAHQNLGNGNPLDSSGRANLLALLTELAASLTGDDVRRPKQPGAVCERHRLDTLAGADFDTSAAATATAQEVIFFPGTGWAQWIGVCRPGKQWIGDAGQQQCAAGPQYFPAGEGGLGCRRRSRCS